MKPLSELKHLLPENPPGTPEGHYWTMNNMGTCEDFLDELTQAFVDYSKDKDVIDIGCGYGTAILAASENGAKKAFACDLDAKQLQIIFLRLNKEGSGYTRICEDFLTVPIEIKDSEFRESLAGKFDAVLLNKVLHVLNEGDAKQGILNAKELLKTGGKVFVKCITPFAKIFTPIFSAVQGAKEASGFDSPTYLINGVHEILPHNFLLFHEISLRKLLEDAEFTVEVCKYIPAHIESMRGELGKDYVMAIARK